MIRLRNVLKVAWYNSVLTIYQKDRYKLTPEAQSKLQANIEKLSANRNEKFGNGRTIRNLFEKVVQLQAVRIAREPTSPVNMIEAVDIPD